MSFWNSLKSSALPLTTKGDILAFTTKAIRLAIGANNKVLTADSTAPEGIAWKDAPAPATPLTTKGDIYAYSTADGKLPVGQEGQVLTVASAEAFGMKWVGGTGIEGAGVTESFMGDYNPSIPSPYIEPTPPAPNVVRVRTSDDGGFTYTNTIGNFYDNGGVWTLEDFGNTRIEYKADLSPLFTDITVPTSGMALFVAGIGWHSYLISGDISANPSGLYENQSDFQFAEVDNFATATLVPSVAGNNYNISKSGTFFGVAVWAGDTVKALVDNPTLVSDWLITSNNVSVNNAPRYTPLTANANAVFGGSYLCKTDAGGFSLTLPTATADDDGKSVRIKKSDISGSNFTLTIARNSQTIMSVASDKTDMADNTEIIITWDQTDGTYRW